MAKIIGLTGGIGSGKTTIANHFRSLGIPVYIADEEAKSILYTPEAIREVHQAFGDEVMTDGKPDRVKLASAVFGNPEKLQKLNNIIHPKVAAHFRQWLKVNTNAPIVIKEAAILFESGSYKDCDKVILVTAPDDVRIQRVMQRDGVSREKVMKRMNMQWPEEKKAGLSDFVIHNIKIEDAKAEAVKILKILNKM